VVGEKWLVVRVFEISGQEHSWGTGLVVCEMFSRKFWREMREIKGLEMVKRSGPQISRMETGDWAMGAKTRWFFIKFGVKFVKSMGYDVKMTEDDDR
jgi:hypothetical protein